MTSPQAEPSAQALGESLAALAVQVAALRGQIAMINQRLDQAGLRADLNLADRFDQLAQAVADALDTAAPRGPPLPTGSAWTATPTTLSSPTCADGPTPYCASTTPATKCGSAGPVTSTPSGNCPPWPPNGTAPTPGHAPTWPGL